MASYPSSIVTLATHNDGDTIPASDINTPNAEIVAMETGLLSGFQHVLKPLTDNTYDIGDSTHAWRDLFVKRNLTHLGLAGVGALLLSNSSKQVIEQALTNGQLVIGSTGAAPVAAALAAGASIYITNAAGSITIASAKLTTLTDGATVALDASLGTVFRLAAGGNRTISAPTNAVDGQKIVIEHFASGGARTLTLTTGSSGAFRFGTDITSLSATASGKTDYIGCIYNSTDSRWDVVAVTAGF